MEKRLILESNRTTYDFIRELRGLTRPFCNFGPLFLLRTCAIRINLSDDQEKFAKAKKSPNFVYLYMNVSNYI